MHRILKTIREIKFKDPVLLIKATQQGYRMALVIQGAKIVDKEVPTLDEVRPALNTALDELMRELRYKWLTKNQKLVKAPYGATGLEYYTTLMQIRYNDIETLMVK